MTARASSRRRLRTPVGLAVLALCALAVPRVAQAQISAWSVVEVTEGERRRTSSASSWIRPTTRRS
jgi:hypothetical protein